MLLNFTVENCLSFKSEQEFTMLRKGRHGTQEEQGAWSRIFPVAVIYGDNAAGKSNLLKCMNFSPISYAIVLLFARALIRSFSCWTVKAQSNRLRSILNSSPKMGTVANTGSVSMPTRCWRKCCGCFGLRPIGAL